MSTVDRTTEELVATLLSDPEFREELRGLVRSTVRRAMADMKATDRLQRLERLDQRNPKAAALIDTLLREFTKEPPTANDPLTIVNTP